MGVAGAGFATMIGQIVGFGMLLSFYLRKKAA
jgi:Na+-driven multidrug efflux pump